MRGVCFRYPPGPGATAECEVFEDRRACGEWVDSNKVKPVSDAEVFAGLFSKEAQPEKFESHIPDVSAEPSEIFKTQRPPAHKAPEVHTKTIKRPPESFEAYSEPVKRSRSLTDAERNL